MKKFIFYFLLVPVFNIFQKYEGWGLSHANYFSFCKIDRSRRSMKIYQWKWMLLGALGCTSINNADFGEKIVNDKFLLDIYY